MLIIMYCIKCGKAYDFDPPDLELDVCECGCAEYSTLKPEEEVVSERVTEDNRRV